MAPGDQPHCSGCLIQSEFQYLAGAHPGSPLTLKNWALILVVCFRLHCTTNNFKIENWIFFVSCLLFLFIIPALALLHSPVRVYSWTSQKQGEKYKKVILVQVVFQDSLPKCEVKAKFTVNGNEVCSVEANSWAHVCPLSTRTSWSWIMNSMSFCCLI